MSHYKVYTVPNNLCKRETIVQIVQVLDHLSSVSQDVFSRINKRIEENAQKLNVIANRIATASTKVECLKSDKRAKTVYSSSKYPAAELNNRDYESIFKEPISIEIDDDDLMKLYYYNNRDFDDAIPKTQSKLQFYNVKTTTDCNIASSDGVPRDIKGINDLLLFDTGRNVVYKDDLELEMEVSENRRRRPDFLPLKETVSVSSSQLGPAPLSISQRSSRRHTTKVNYFYTPKVKELPALDVPLDLPDLPGIADDVVYDIQAVVATTTTISPSSIIKVSSRQQLEQEKEDLPDIDPQANVEFDLVPSVPPPPPPPAVAATVVKEEEQPRKSFIATQEEKHANLMDAIRKAGGRVVNLRKPPSEPKTNPASGDLMADLHMKLMMRRKGIQGTKEAAASQGNVSENAFARMSSIIPPPAAKVSSDDDVSSGVSTEDEDWNDD